MVSIAAKFVRVGLLEQDQISRPNFSCTLFTLQLVLLRYALKWLRLTNALKLYFTRLPANTIPSLHFL